MERIASPAGATVSYDRRGSGPPLVLVHGGFSDHETNWAVSVAAVARCDAMCRCDARAGWARRCHRSYAGVWVTA